MDTNLSRREFLKTTASAAVGAAFAVAGARGLLAAAGRHEPEGPAREKQKETLPVRPLGATGEKVSIVGLGGDGLVSDSTDKEAVTAFLTAALDGGINYIDTAHLYGKDGRCETNLGLVMGTDRRKGVFLATKTGARTYDTAMQQVEMSLKRMKVTTLDLVQVHHLNDKDDLKALGGKGGALAALGKLRDQKVVRFLGLTGHPDSANVVKAIEMYHWDTLMCFVNPAKFSRPALDDQLPAATKKKMGVVAMKALGGRPGKLVGKEKGQADAATLLRYALGQDVATVLLGMGSLAQLQEDLKIARAFKPLTAEESAALVERINSTAKPWSRTEDR